MLYCAFHFSALSGWPVTMPASRQFLVLGMAGASCAVARPPKPHRANPSLRLGSSARVVVANLVIHGAPAVAKVVALRKRRRLVKMPFMRPRLQHGKCQRKSVPRPPALDMNSLKDHQFVIDPTYNPERGPVSIIENQAVS